VASNRFFKQEEEMQKEVSFFEVSTWARLAEVCGEYLKKDRWTDQEGKPHSRVSIVAEHVEFEPQFKDKDGDGAQEGAEKAEGSLPEDLIPRNCRAATLPNQNSAWISNTALSTLPFGTISTM
jgi:single-strand DNA-binding protein